MVIAMLLDFQLQRVVQWQSSKHSVKRSVRGKRKNLIVKLTMTDSETDLAKIVQMQSQNTTSHLEELVASSINSVNTKDD